MANSNTSLENSDDNSAGSGFPTYRFISSDSRYIGPSPHGYPLTDSGFSNRTGQHLTVGSSSGPGLGTGTATTSFLEDQQLRMPNALLQQTDHGSEPKKQVSCESQWQKFTLY